MPEPEWLKNAQTLAEMVRELRKAEAYVEQIQKNIRRFLRTRGCCRHVPWGAAGKPAKKHHHARVDAVSYQRDKPRSGAKGVLHHQPGATVIKLDFNGRGKSDQLNGHVSD